MISSSQFKGWLFASQYLKACKLLPRLINSKVTLLKMYNEKAEHEHQVKPLTRTFLERHNEFDKIINAERKSIRNIRRWFTLLDVCMGMLTIVLIAFDRYFVLNRIKN